MKIGVDKAKPIQLTYSTGRQYTKKEVDFFNCPLCEKDDYKTIAVERSVLAIVRCRLCGLIYVNPRLKSPQKVYWGDAAAYFEEARLIFEGNKPHHRDRNYLDDLKIIKKYKPKGNFLDVGCNAGFFLRLARKNSDWKVCGVEPSKPLADLGCRCFNLNIKNAYLEEAGFEDNFFDIVTMTDVFEHVINPGSMLQAVRKIIKDNGILYIKVPNGLFNVTKLHLARLTNASLGYDIFDSYEHLVHYSHKTLARMLKKNGFSIIYRGQGRPIHTPAWEKYTGRYYQYPSPFILDYKNHLLRNLFFFLGRIEYLIKGLKPGYLSPNIIVIARKHRI